MRADILLIARIFPRPFRARKNTTQPAKYPHVLYVKPSNKVYIISVATAGTYHSGASRKHHGKSSRARSGLKQKRSKSNPERGMYNSALMLRSYHYIK